MLRFAAALVMHATHAIPAPAESQAWLCMQQMGDLQPPPSVCKVSALFRPLDVHRQRMQKLPVVWQGDTARPSSGSGTCCDACDSA